MVTSQCIYYEELLHNSMLCTYWSTMKAIVTFPMWLFISCSRIRQYETRSPWHQQCFQLTTLLPTQVFRELLEYHNEQVKLYLINYFTSLALGTKKSNTTNILKQAVINLNCSTGFHYFSTMSKYRNGLDSVYQNGALYYEVMRGHNTMKYDYS